MRAAFDAPGAGEPDGSHELSLEVSRELRGTLVARVGTIFARNERDPARFFSPSLELAVSRSLVLVAHA